MKRLLAGLLLCCSCATTTVEYVTEGPNEASFNVNEEIRRSSNAYISLWGILRKNDDQLSDVQRKSAELARIAAIVSLGVWMVQHVPPEDANIVYATTNRLISMAMQKEIESTVSSTVSIEQTGSSTTTSAP